MSLLVVLADTRVGSTALGLGLTETEGSSFLGEILYPQPSKALHHLYELVCTKPIGEMLDKTKLYDLLDKHFSPLYVSQNLYIVDIKYHDLSIFPIHPSSPQRVPSLLQYFFDRNLKIVHLNRRNKAAAVISEEIAIQTKRLHILADGVEESPATTPDPLTLNVFNTVASVIERESNHLLVRQWMSIAGLHAIDVEYEAVLKDSAGIHLLLEHMKKRWDIRNIDFSFKTKRISKLNKPIITNLDDILKAVQGTTYEFQFREIEQGYW